VTEVNALLSTVRARLEQAGRPGRAKQQQAYMKSAMPFWGVDNASVRKIAREARTAHAVIDAKRWRADVLALWRGAST
jgi:hypothetical protein